jgi:hypothetical protein
MAITIEIDEKANLRKHTVTGNVTFDEVFAELKRVYLSPDFQPDMNSLWDITKAKVTSMSSAEIHKVSDFVAAHWGPGGKSRAALVVSTDFEFGISRMVEILLESRMSAQVQVFRDIDEALKWVTSQSLLTSQPEEQ